uniref:Retrovirus-related Pol polyprotein from transposon TNT 1-94 n=1 Tax=Tanacetum cinerariifolium TaxID=118510 RepID=A0A6L2M2J8_TANCI|nr:retrovirus-related Pol polyprotein from transposon TNT 1-94 [Tanacetum cinerariifolium]
MPTLAEFMILSGGDNRPPMLENHLYDSWKIKMELYMQNREHGRKILESVEHGLLIWPTIEENGLPSDVYSLFNHHRVAKDLWERVQLLMQVHQDACPQPKSIPQIEYTVSTVNQTHLAEFPQINSSIAVYVFKKEDDLIDAINKMISFMSTVGRQSSFVAGTFRTRANISGTGGNNAGQQRVVKCFNCQEEGSGKVLNEEELEFLADPRVVEAKAVLMANLSSYGSDVLFEIKAMLYDGSVISKETNVISIADSEETLMLEKESRSKMFLKQSDPIVLDNKVNIKPINYAELNRLSKDFGKRFVPQQELSDEQAFRLQTSHLILTNLLLRLLKLRLLGNFLRITATNKVPFGEPILLEVVAQESVVTKVYTRRPSVPNTAGFNSKPKIAKSIISNKTEPGTSRGSNTLVASSSFSLVDLMFLGTVKFDNDQIAKIIGILRNQPLYIVNWGYDGVISNLSLVQSLKDQNLVMALSIVTFELWQNRTLVLAARTMLIYAKAPLFLWAEAVATAYYTQNRSIIRRRHGKIPYELLRGRKPDLFYLHVFRALCYPNNDTEDLGKLQAKSDIGIFIGYAPKKNAYRIYNRRTQKIIETIHVDFDELTAMAFEQLGSGPRPQSMTPATSIPVANAPRVVDLADSPVSTSIDQDAPSTSIPSTLNQEHSLIISQGFEESPKPTHFHDDPLYESLYEDSTSQGSSSNVRPIHSSFESLGRWTKDHPIANVIGDPSCSVSIRKQLQTDAIWCYFDAFLTSVEPKNFKQAMTEPS